MSHSKNSEAPGNSLKVVASASQSEKLSRSDLADQSPSALGAQASADAADRAPGSVRPAGNASDTRPSDTRPSAQKTQAAHSALGEAQGEQAQKDPTQTAAGEKAQARSRGSAFQGFVDGAKLQGTHTLSPEICIVGSGAGGAVSAAVLAQAGFEVLVLEEGGHYTQRDFRMLEDEAYPTLYQEDGGRSTEDLAISIMQGRSVGGSTTVNWTTCFRTPDSVIHHWAATHGVKGFKPEDLLEHFEAVEERLGIEEIPLSAANRNNQTLYQGCVALGYEVSPVRRNVRNCYHTGYCGLGCPTNAKQAMHLSYLPDAVAAGAVVLSRCRADRISFSAGEALSVDCTLLGQGGVHPTGARLEVRPKHIILAGGAINTPALLLRSGFDGNGLVGKRTYLHPTVAQLGEYPEAVAGYHGAPQAVASHHFVHRGEEVGFVLETSPAYPMLASLALPGFGREHQEAMEKLSHSAAHIALMVDGFHPDEAGGKVKVRKSGAPVLDYPIPERVFRGMRVATRELAKIQLASGAKRSCTTHDPPYLISSESDLAGIDALPYEANRLGIFSAHVMGGMAMGDDPKQGVVSSESFRVHGLKNVYTIDGSLFPTSLGVNPQLSIFGLARLAAGRLVAALKRA